MQIALVQPALDDGLILTEVYYNTPGRDADQEWVEIVNFGERDPSTYRF